MNIASYVFHIEHEKRKMFQIQLKPTLRKSAFANYPLQR